MSESYQIALITLGIVALVLLIVVLLYAINAYRRIGIVAKKADYLVEDLTYKSEMLMPTFDAVSKLTKYTDLLEKYVNNRTPFAYDYIKKDKPSKITHKKENKTKKNSNKSSRSGK